MQKKKILYLDILRIIATFAVIAIHVSAYFFYDYPVDSYEWCAFNFYDAITHFAAPVFCMITGALFLNKDKKISTRSLYTKNISRLLIALYVWSAIYTVYSFDVAEIGQAEFLKKFMGCNFHLWYILLTIGFYALVPLFRRISSSKSTTQYLLCIAFIVTFVIPALSLIPNLDWMKRNVNRAFLFLPLGYTPYFFFGYYISKYGLTKKIKTLIYILGPLSFVATTLGTLVISQMMGEFYSELYDYESITVLFQALFVFVAVKDIFENITPSEKASKFVSTISKHTFGVYLVHQLILTELDLKLGINAVMLNPYIAIPVTVLITYLISEIISAILNSIPLLKKYIV